MSSNHTPRSFKELAKWFWISVLVVYLLPILLFAIAVITSAFDAGDVTATEEIVTFFGFLLACLAFVFGIVGMVCYLKLIYRCWTLIQDGSATTTPGRAVGFLFIPFFNLYWIFIAVSCLAQDMNDYCDSRGIGNSQRDRINTGLSCAACVITLVPWVNAIAVFFYIPLLISFGEVGARIQERK